MQNEVKSSFLNRRDWGSYLIALQSAANCPKVLDAVKSSRDWVAQGAAHASNWLAVSAGGEVHGKLSAG